MIFQVKNWKYVIVKVNKTGFFIKIFILIKFKQKAATPKMSPSLRLVSMVCPLFVPILVKVWQFAVSFCREALLMINVDEVTLTSVYLCICVSLYSLVCIFVFSDCSRSSPAHALFFASGRHRSQCWETTQIRSVTAGKLSYLIIVFSTFRLLNLFVCAYVGLFDCKIFVKSKICTDN